MAMRWGRLYEGTSAEHSLEDAVAKLGVPYRTQFPGWKYGCRFFPDFVLPTLGIVIEVDDASHDRTDKKLKDADRSDTIADVWGWRVLRCSNNDALFRPHETVKRLLSEAGLYPIPETLPKMRDALPSLKRAPRAERRKAKSLNRRKARQKRN